MNFSAMVGDVRVFSDHGDMSLGLARARRRSSRPMPGSPLGRAVAARSCAGRCSGRHANNDVLGEGLRRRIGRAAAAVDQPEAPHHLRRRERLHQHRQRVLRAHESDAVQRPARHGHRQLERRSARYSGRIALVQRRRDRGGKVRCKACTAHAAAVRRVPQRRKRQA